jgi:hypothetical protein
VFLSTRLVADTCTVGIAGEAAERRKALRRVREEGFERQRHAVALDLVDQCDERGAVEHRHLRLGHTNPPCKPQL